VRSPDEIADILLSEQFADGPAAAGPKAQPKNKQTETKLTYGKR
jgi:hypothetical protein